MRVLLPILAASAISSFAFADVLEDDGLESLSEDDLAFFADDGADADADEADFTPRFLKRKNVFRRSRPKCAAVRDQAGVDMCRRKGGRCVVSAGVCKRITRGRGFFVPSLCHDVNPNTQEKNFCGCCVKRPRKFYKLTPPDLTIKFAAAAELGDGSRISLSGSLPTDGSSVPAISKITVAAISETNRSTGLALPPGGKVTVTPDPTGGPDLIVEAKLLASSKDIDSIKGLEPEVHHETDNDGHFFTIPQTLPSRIRLVISKGSSQDDVGKIGKALGDGNDQRDFELEQTPFRIVSCTIDIQPTPRQQELGIQPSTRSYKDLELPVQAAIAPSLKLRERLNEPKFFFWPPILLKEEHLNLCLQPVRVRHRECATTPWFGFICWSGWTYTYSGDGYAFGKPGVEDQWAKVDITFTWRPWKTIIDNAGKYKAVTEAEMGDFKREVSDDDDCVEIFFAPKFSPSSTYGGGACWGSGTAGAQIVTSDEQVACGVDKTHLAHEVGHALGIMHPGTGHATYADGSTGTLLCGSGWERDNPRRNSRDNGDNVVNPLLTCYMDTINWFNGPDCTSSADCGSCSAHIPSDSC